MDNHPNNPGLYLTGDNTAEVWHYLTGAGATSLRSQYMNFNLVSGDHVSNGDDTQPLLEGNGDIFVHNGAPDLLKADGGCPLINDFDLLQPTGLSQVEMVSQAAGNAYILSQSTPNNAGSDGRAVLSGFSFSKILKSTGTYDSAVAARHLRYIIGWLEGSSVNELDFSTLSDLQLSNDLCMLVQNILISDPWAYILQPNICSGASLLYVVNITDTLNPYVAGNCELPEKTTGLDADENYIYISTEVDGIRVVDIAIPGTPAVVGAHDIEGSSNDIALAGNYVFIANGTEGLKVFDISLPSSPDSVSHLPLNTPAKAISIAGNYAYIAAGDSMYTVDISSPLDPQRVSSCGTEGALDIAVSGDYAFTASSSTGPPAKKLLEILSISDPQNPSEVSQLSLSASPKCVFVEQGKAYLTLDWGGVLTVIDVSNPADPVLDGRHSPEFTQYNKVAVEGGRIYATYHYYNGDADERGGLHIMRPSESITDSDTPEPRYSNFLAQNYPNPFNPSTVIRFGILREGAVKLRIFDVSGRLVRTLVDETKTPGKYTAVWYGSNDSGKPVASGVYFYLLEAKEYRKAKKLVLIR